MATAPAIPTLLLGRTLSLLWDVPLVVEMRECVAGSGHGRLSAPSAPSSPEAADAVQRGALRRVVSWSIALAKGEVHQKVTSWQSGARAVVTTTGRFADVLRERGVSTVHVVRNGARSVPWSHRGAIICLGDDPEELRCLYLGNMGRSRGWTQWSARPRRCAVRVWTCR